MISFSLAHEDIEAAARPSANEADWDGAVVRPQARRLGDQPEDAQPSQLGAQSSGAVEIRLRSWLRARTENPDAVLSGTAADYLERIATDGTLEAALNEIAAPDPELAG